MSVILSWGVYKQIILGRPWGNEPMSDIGLLLVTLFIFTLTLAIIMLFRYSKLETSVDRWAVRFRFPPFIPNWKEIPKQDVNEYKIRKYSFLRSYGVKWGLDGIKTLNVKRNKGVEIHYRKEKKIIIGTQQPELFMLALDKMMKPETE